MKDSLQPSGQSVTLQSMSLGIPVLISKTVGFWDFSKFRDEENIISDASVSSSYYKNIISPYKGVLEKWFVLNKGKYVYFMTIFITMWVIFLPNSKIAWKVFGNLPSPPDELKKVLNYSK